MRSSKALVTADYSGFLADLKARILRSRITAVRAVNRELIQLYWDIGRGIVGKQKTAGWGNSVVERLARDLQDEFPDMRGFSIANIWRMRQLYEACANASFLAQAARELAPTPKGIPSSENLAQLVRDLVSGVPWGHLMLMLGKLKAPAPFIYYLRATAQFGWSRSVLLNQIKSKAYERSVKENKSHNFPLALPEYIAEQAGEMMKSRYSLEFLGITRAVKERELEDRLIGRLQQFILELGYGFCFVGRQYRLALGSKEYFVDLLFYHRFLKSLVAFDLKIGSFEPEHAGKMDFYLNLLNDKERAPEDNPSIGIILCAEKDDIEVEFALKSKANPIGVAEYKLQPKLPAEFKGRLPTAKQLASFVREAMPDRKK